MEAELLIAGIDAAVKLITLFANGSGAAAKVSQIVAARIADGGRDWTDAERQAVTDEVAAQKAYALEQLGQPDAAPGIAP